MKSIHGGKKKTYSINIPIAQIYLYKLGKLGLGNRYDENFYFTRKITLEQLTIAKEIMGAVSFFGFNVFEKWRCPVIQHSSEKIIYCLTEYGIWAYCCEMGCKYGVYINFNKYRTQTPSKNAIQISLLRQRIDNSKEHTVMKPEVTTSNHLEAVINSNEFQVFCNKKCPLSEEKCTTYCPILTLHQTLK